MSENRVQVQVIALLGESLLMDSIEASLGSEPDLDVIRLSLDPGASGLWLTAPHMIITDLNELHQRTIVSYLKRFPDTPMVGIDATSHRATMISYEPFSVRSTEDLTTVIRDRLLPHPEPRASRELVMSVGAVNRL